MVSRLTNLVMSWSQGWPGMQGMALYVSGTICVFGLAQADWSSWVSWIADDLRTEARDRSCWACEESLMIRLARVVRSKRKEEISKGKRIELKENYKRDSIICCQGRNSSLTIWATSTGLSLNEHWVAPMSKQKPQNSQMVESPLTLMVIQWAHFMGG